MPATTSPIRFGTCVPAYTYSHAFPGARAYPRARARLCVWRLPLARLLIEPVTALYSTLLLALVVAVELLAAAGNGVYLPCLSPPSSQLRNKAKRALQHELQISALARALLLWLHHMHKPAPVHTVAAGVSTTRTHPRLCPTAAAGPQEHYIRPRQSK